MRFVAPSFFFYVPNFVRFDAGMLKLQQMIKWDQGSFPVKKELER